MFKTNLPILLHIPSIQICVHTVFWRHENEYYDENHDVSSMKLHLCRNDDVYPEDSV